MSSKPGGTRIWPDAEAGGPASESPFLFHFLSESCIVGSEPNLVLYRKEDIINTKIYVGNLSYDTTEGDVASLFSEVGSILEVFLPSDHNTGRPRGFAFVEYTDEAAAEQAIEKFDGFSLDGRTLTVKEAEARPERSKGFSDNRPGGKYRGRKKTKSKGSRRGLRGKKRGF